jgi:hypothetical protein
MSEDLDLPPQVDAPPAYQPAYQPWGLPIGLAIGALVVALVAATVQLLGEHARLADLWKAQAAQMQQAVKFREQLQSLGAETARLADNGDAAAKKIVEAMKQQGVTLTAGEH